VPKKAVKIPAARKSAGVRWTLQVSADANEKPASASKSHAKRTSEKPQPTRARKTPARKNHGARQAAAPATVAARGPAPASALARAASVKRAPQVSLTAGRRMAAIAAGSAIVIAALAVMRDPSGGASANVHAQPATRDALVSTIPAQPEAPVVPRPAMTSTAARVMPGEPRQPSTQAVRRDAIPAPLKPSVGPAAPTPAALAAATSVNEGSARPGTPELHPATLAARSTGSPEPSSAAAVTITGCLEGTVDGGEFRLTDTDGADAPKSRGWRSGFLKKRPAAVELVNIRDTSAFRRLVGHRVVTTGLLGSRELSVHSIASAGGTCD
jgi:hypothetical protein